MHYKRKYNYFYKITNNINNHFYYGIHSTDNLDDGYMGSGSRLKFAYKKYGIENFTKEILKFFDTREECAEYEAEMITEELQTDINCYNIAGGGDGFASSGTITAKSKDGEYYQISINDPKWLSGEFVGSTTGFTNCIDIETGKYVQLPNEYFIKNKDKYKGVLYNKCVCTNKETNTRIIVSCEEFKNNRNKYETTFGKKLTYKDKYGKYFFVAYDDERVLNGELVPIWKGKTHSEESKQKMRETCKMIKHQQGEKNSQFGTCWITKDSTNKKIKQSELDIYITNGWVKGRKIK